MEIEPAETELSIHLQEPLVIPLASLSAADLHSSLEEDTTGIPAPIPTAFQPPFVD